MISNFEKKFVQEIPTILITSLDNSRLYEDLCVNIHFFMSHTDSSWTHSRSGVPASLDGHYRMDHMIRIRRLT